MFLFSFQTETEFGGIEFESAEKLKIGRLDKLESCQTTNDDEYLCFVFPPRVKPF